MLLLPTSEFLQQSMREAGARHDFEVEMGAQCRSKPQEACPTSPASRASIRLSSTHRGRHIGAPRTYQMVLTSNESGTTYQMVLTSNESGTTYQMVLTSNESG